jgi:hypothetical protein
MEIINAKGLEEKPVAFDNLVFIDRQEGYLFGSRPGDPEWGVGGKLTRIDTSTVFRTIDGGKSWKSNSSGNQVIKNISLSDGEIYGEKSPEDLNKFSTIYKLNRTTCKWEEYSQINGFVRNFQVFNHGLEAVCIMKNNDLLATENKGKSWYKLLQLARIDQIIITGKDVYGIGASITDTAPFSTVFAKYNLGTKKSSLIPFPKGFRAYCLDENIGEFFFLGLQQDRVELYKLSKEGTFSLIHKIYTGTRIFPKKLNVFGREIAIVIGERESLSVTNRIYWSMNKGNTWVEKVLRNSSYSGPIWFLNDINKQSFLTWRYCSLGELQLIGGMK